MPSCFSLAAYLPDLMPAVLHRHAQSSTSQKETGVPFAARIHVERGALQMVVLKYKVLNVEP